MALLSTLEPSTDDPATPRGLLRLGGRSLVEHQLETALTLGCEKVICLADGLPGELIALQHGIERSGVQFQIAADGQAVAQAIKSEDDLLVFSDGLVASAETVAAVLGVKSGVVVQPVEAGVAAGYERLDLNHAGGGVFRLPGTTVAGLADLPGEWNPVSALLRLAMQASLRQAVLPPALLAEGAWTLIRSDAEAHRFEPHWLRRHTGRLDHGGPGHWLAARLVERIGPALLHAGTRPAALGLGAAALGLIALLLAWYELFSPAFALLALAWLVRRCGSILARIHGDRPRLPWLQADTVFPLVGDAACAAIAAFAFADAGGGPDGLVRGGFVAVVLLGLLRLVEAVFSDRPWAVWVADRFVCNLALAVAALGGMFDLALAGAVLGVLALGLAGAYRPAGARAAGGAEDASPADRLTRP